MVIYFFKFELNNVIISIYLGGNIFIFYQIFYYLTRYYSFLDLFSDNEWYDF